MKFSCITSFGDACFAEIRIAADLDVEFGAAAIADFIAAAADAGDVGVNGRCGSRWRRTGERRRAASLPGGPAGFGREAALTSAIAWRAFLACNFRPRAEGGLGAGIRPAAVRAPMCLHVQPDRS